MSRPDLSLAREFEAALAWWQAAGLDCEFADDATALLRAVPAAAPGASARLKGEAASPSAAEGPARRAALPVAEPVPEPVKRNLLGESPPQDLAAFRQWWLEADGLAPARGFARVAPYGQAGAALMVLVPAPEETDRERLLDGPQGRLLAAILAATGHGAGDVYVAAALPSHTPMPDLAGLAAEGFGDVVRHHVALVAPARLMVFGTGLAPMLGAGPDADLREFNYIRGKVPVLVSETLDALMNMPRLKARFWRRWMEWSATH